MTNECNKKTLKGSNRNDLGDVLIDGWNLIWSFWQCKIFEIDRVAMKLLIFKCSPTANDEQIFEDERRKDAESAHESKSALHPLVE